MRRGLLTARGLIRATIVFLRAREDLALRTRQGGLHGGGVRAGGTGQGSRGLHRKCLLTLLYPQNKRDPKRPSAGPWLWVDPSAQRQEMDLRQLAPAKGSWLLSLSSGQSRSEDSGMEGLTARMLVVQGEPLERAAGTQVRTPALARTEADSRMGLFVKVLCTAPATQSPTRPRALSSASAPPTFPAPSGYLLFTPEEHLLGL